MRVDRPIWLDVCRWRIMCGVGMLPGCERAAPKFGFTWRAAVSVEVQYVVECTPSASQSDQTSNG